MPLEERLELSIDDALSRIDQAGQAVEDRFDQAATSFKVALAEALDVLKKVEPVEVTADAAPVTASIDAAVLAADTTVTPEAATGDLTTQIDDAVKAADTTTTPIEADTTSVASSIDAAVSGVTPAPLEVPVDAESITGGIDEALSSVDTSPLSNELGDVASKASRVGAAGSEAGVGIGSIAPAAALATGELGGLTDIVGQITPGMAEATGATVGLAVAGKTLFDAALAEDTALARLRQTFGDLAGQVEHVNFGGINEDLTTLAVRTGANVAGLENFAASFGQLGTSAGDSLPHIAQVSQEVILLAERASVLNPNLGTADEIVQRLSTSLARGGRFLSAYGLSLSTAQINAEALRETGKSTVAELSNYEKEVAGATLATQQLGSSLGTDINAGSQKAIVQLRSLKASFENDLATAGRDSIGPVIAALKDLEPVLSSVGSIFGTSLAAGLHLVVPLLQAFAPLLQGVADLLKGIPQPVTEGVIAFLALSRILPVVEGFLVSLVGSIAAPTAAFAGLGAEAEITATATAAAGTEIEATGLGLGALAGPIGIAIAAIGLLSGAMGHAGDVAKTLGDAAGKDLVSAFDEMVRHASGDKLLPGFLQLDQALGLTKTHGEALRDTFKKLADENPAAAQRLIDALRAEGRNVADLEPILAKSSASHRQLAADQQANADATGQMSDVSKAAAPPLKALAAATQSLADATLSHLVVTGQITQAQLAANLAVHTGKDGTIDYAAALKDLDPTTTTAIDRQARLNAGLGDVRTGFERAKDAADIFKTALDEGVGVLLSVESATSKQSDAETKLATAVAGSGDAIASAQRGAEQAHLATAKAVDQHARAEDTLGALLRRGAVDQQAVATALREEESASRSLEQAKDSLAKAEENLQRIAADAPAKAADERTRATLDLRGATLGVTRAEQDLAKARAAAPTPGVDKGLAIAEAQLTLDQAVERQKESQEALNAINRDGTQAEAQLATAREQVTNATQAVADRTQAVIDATTKMHTAQAGDPDFNQKVAAARDAVASASQGIADAQDRERVSLAKLNAEKAKDPTQGIADAVAALVKADEDLIDAQVRASGGAISSAQARDGLIRKLHEEEDRYPSLRGQIDQYIAKVQAIPPEELTRTGLPNIGDSENALSIYVEQLNNIPAEKKTVIEADVTGLAELHALIDQLNQLPPDIRQQVILANRGVNRLGAMAGGDFSPWQPVLVGEAGPEVVTFPVPWHVTPNGQAPPGQAGGLSTEDIDRIVNAIAKQRPIQVFEAVDARTTADAIALRFGQQVSV